MPDDPGEQHVIDILLAARPDPRRHPHAPRVDAGDDAALLADGTLVTADTLVEGIHWDDRSSPDDVGWKAVAVNASDIGAMGGRPSWATLAMCLPRPLDTAWVDAFSRGLQAACAHFGVVLVGGDTTRSPGPRVVSITMGGTVVRPVLRSGGRAGDQLFVTGTPGQAAAGFLSGGPALGALTRPMPPVAMGAEIGENGLASAMLDISDGIGRDLSRLARASGVGAVVDPTALPLSPQLRALARPLDAQVAFGDDYELLMSVPAEQVASVQALAQRHDRRLTRIGHLTVEPEVRLLGCPWPAALFSHFDRTQP